MDLNFPVNFELIPHTADIGFRVWGETLPDLFANAAYALTSQIIEIPKIAPDKTTFVRLNAETREELLVKWLEELLFLFETDNFLGLEFRVTQCDGASLSATVHGFEWDFSKCLLKTQVKAVTFHGLQIKREENRFVAEVILDV